jgi:hypothetical protein
MLNLNSFKKYFPIIILSTILAGCAVSGPVKNVATSKSGFDGAAYAGVTRLIVDDQAELDKYPINERYRVFEQSYTSYGSIPEARDQAEPRAIEFCRAKNKKMKILEEITSTPPHILGNWPRIEIIFACVDKSKN